MQHIALMSARRYLLSIVYRRVAPTVIIDLYIVVMCNITKTSTGTSWSLLFENVVLRNHPYTTHETRGGSLCDPPKPVDAPCASTRQSVLPVLPRCAGFSCRYCGMNSASNRILCTSPLLSRCRLLPASSSTSYLSQRSGTEVAEETQR